MRHKENLYGKLPTGEGELIVKAMKRVALAEREKLVHPADLAAGYEFDPQNPLGNTCDLAVALLGLIYGDTVNGGAVQRYWFYKNESRAKQGLMANKEGVHYRYFNAKTGLLDFTNCQFPVGYFLYRHLPDKKGFEFGGAKMKTRLNLLVPDLYGFCRKELEDNDAIAYPSRELLYFLDL